MLVQAAQCEQIAGRTQTRNLSHRDSGHMRMMAKFFPLVNIRQMHFNGGQADRRNGIPDCDAGMGIGGRINDDPVVSASEPLGSR